MKSSEPDFYIHSPWNEWEVLTVECMLFAKFSARPVYRILFGDGGDDGDDSDG